MQRPHWDIVLIARNEAKTLPRLLGSLSQFKEFGGRVFIVDTGSKDETVEVARSWGATVTDVGDRFRIIISKEQAEAINTQLVVEGEEAVIKEGDSLFDFSSARNFAASLATQDWIWMPDCDEAFTQLDIPAINAAIADPEIDILRYDFVFSHDEQGEPAISFSHAKMYRKDKVQWRGRVHEVLSNIRG